MIKNFSQLTRLSAFGLHFGISLLVLLVLAAFVVYLWYPGFFFDTDGGWHGMRIIIAVHLVLGPLLTLIVFKAGKPGLKMDLTLICLFQAACLAGGTYVVYSERPVAIVYALGEFYVTSQDTYSASGKTTPDLSEIPGRPKWVMVKLPEDAQSALDVKRDYFNKTKPLYTADEHYEPFDPSDREFMAAAEDLSVIEEKDKVKNFLGPFLAQHGGEITDYRFYPYSTRYQYTYLVFSRSNQFIGMLETPAF